MVRLGEHNLKSDNDGADPQNIKIDSIIKHPEYKPPMKYHDIALLKLESPARYLYNLSQLLIFSIENLQYIL